MNSKESAKSNAKGKRPKVYTLANAELVAYLLECGWEHDAILSALGLRKPDQVSKLIAMARGKGWLKRVDSFAAPTPERRLEVEAFAAPASQELRAALRPLGVRTVWVHPTLGNQGKRTVSTRSFGRAAAVVVSRWLLQGNCRTLAVAWGETLRALTRGLEAIHAGPPRREDPIVVLPARGESFGPTSGMSPSALAARLSRVLNGAPQAPEVVRALVEIVGTRTAAATIPRASHVANPRPFRTLSLTAIPAVIPLTLSGAKERAIRELIELSPAYRYIFGGWTGLDGNSHAPRIADLDMMITSAGPSEAVVSSWSAECLELQFAGHAGPRLGDLVVGDVAGVLIPRRGLSRREEAEFRRIRRHLVGLQFDHLERCAARGRAERDPRPGVFLLCVGAEKAAITLELATLGVVNHLLIDGACAEAMVNLLPEATLQADERRLALLREPG